jgi:DNA modification methylase
MNINKIYNENCLDTMARMEDNFIDLTVTSPPYDNLRDYNGYEFDFESIANELYRVTKQGGVVVWVVGDATINGSETGTSFKQALYLKECGFNLHDTMIYKKGGQGATGSVYAYWQDFEFMFVFTKGKLNTFNPIQDRKNVITRESRKESSGHRKTNGEKKGKRIIKRKAYGRRFNVWEYHENGTKTDHPAVFPEYLAADHIISWSNEGDLIYDPFMGSGTTAKMAHLLKRNWVGSEISLDYVELANKRIKPYLQQLRMF